MNQLEQIARLKNDHRQIMIVSLQREGREKYWEFNCPRCKAKICEINGDMVYMGDLWNDVRPTPILMRCPGTNKKWCRYWFGFILS